MLVANPLDHYELFLEEAIQLTYHFVAKNTEETLWNCIPSVELIEKYLPEHFEQELALMIVTKEAYGDVGALNKDDFLYKLKEGNYRRYIPNRSEIIRYLNASQLSFVEIFTEGDYLRNGVVMEVW